MTLTEKIDALALAFGKDAIRYADRAEWNYPYYADHGHWTFKEKCPDHVSYSEVHNYPAENTRVYIDLSRVGRGDDYYDQTTTLDRSNYRSLRRDYPDTFTVTSYTNVDSLGAYVGNLSEDLISILTGLVTDYPLYDESDHSELEHDEITESWEQYVSSDLSREIYDAHADEGDAWDGLTTNQQRDMFWAAVEATDSYPEHDGHDIRWQYDAIVTELARRLGIELAT